MWRILVSVLLLDLCKSEVTSNDITEEPNNPGKHHKVHNLVLYPEKHSWCELKPIRQIVTHAHCQSKEMENYVCVGTCFSYSVPQTEPEIPGDKMLDYCDSCQAEESHWTIVTLDCEHDGAVFEVRKNIQMITNCSCSACSPVNSPVVSNSVFDHDTQRITDLLHKMMPEGHKMSETPSKYEHKGYSSLSVGDIKKEFSLNAAQEGLLAGKNLIRHDASFVEDNEEVKAARGFTAN